MFFCELFRAKIFYFQKKFSKAIPKSKRRRGEHGLETLRKNQDDLNAGQILFPTRDELQGGERREIVGVSRKDFVKHDFLVAEKSGA